VDELKDRISQFKLGNKRIVISGDASEFPVIEKIKPLTPMTIMDMIIEMEGPIMENIHTLVAASKKKLLKVEK
jgi:hypothetical protein